MSSFNVKYLLLLFAAFYGSDAFSQTVTISPANSTKSCGRTVTRYFSATPSGFTGTVYYSWNAGTNGFWKYNGTALTSPVSTGTSPSITLTADACAIAPPNVIVTAANGTKTASATAYVTQPTFLINGSSTLCDDSPKTYSIDSLTCSSTTYSWSVTPSGYVSPSSGTGSTFTIYKTGSGATINVHVTLTNACSSTPMSLNKTVTVGPAIPPLTGTYSAGGTTYTMYTVNGNVPSGVVNAYYSWPGISNPVATLAPNSQGSNFTASSGGFSFKIAAGEQVAVYITGTNSCGQVRATRTFVQGGSFTVTTSPNPASNYINVKITPQQADKKTPAPAAAGKTVISLYNSQTGSLLQQWKFSEAMATDYNLKLFNTKEGMYNLRVDRNGQSVTAKIMIGEK